MAKLVAKGVTHAIGRRAGIQKYNWRNIAQTHSDTVYLRRKTGLYDKDASPLAKFC